MTISFSQNEPGVDYDDIQSVMAHVPNQWWLEHELCKYILTVLVHKDNKDLSSSPTRLPAGDTRANAREKKEMELAEVRRAAKAERPVEKYGDVDHQMKKVRVDGMRSQVEKNIVDSIVSQINVMRDNADIYKAMFGEEKYREKIAQLMNKLPGLGEVNVEKETVGVPEVDLTLTSSVGDEDDEENYGTGNSYHHREPITQDVAELRDEIRKLIVEELHALIKN